MNIPATPSIPFFSIVIPLYNAALYIETTLKSIFAQTYQDFEIIIINDGSTDGGEKLAEAIGGPRIRIIHQQNAGVSVARNVGIQAARGEFIAFMDADDAWKTNHLELVAQFFKKNPDYHWFVTNYQFVDDIDDRMIHEQISGKVSFKVVNWFLRANNIPLSANFVMRKSAIPQADFFPPGVKMYEDNVAFCRMALRHPMIGTSNCITTYYRIQENSASHVHQTQRIGKSFAAADAFMLQQEMYILPDCPPEAKLFLRYYAYIILWKRIRETSLLPWVSEFEQRSPILGKWLTLWLTSFCYFSEFFCRTMAKMIRFKITAIEKQMNKTAADSEIALQDIYIPEVPTT